MIRSYWLVFSWIWCGFILSRANKIADSATIQVPVNSCLLVTKNFFGSISIYNENDITTSTVYTIRNSNNIIIYTFVIKQHYDPFPEVVSCSMILKKNESIILDKQYGHIYIQNEGKENICNPETLYVGNITLSSKNGFSVSPDWHKFIINNSLQVSKDFSGSIYFKNKNIKENNIYTITDEQNNIYKFLTMENYSSLTEEVNCSMILSSEKYVILHKQEGSFYMECEGKENLCDPGIRYFGNIIVCSENGFSVLSDLPENIRVIKKNEVSKDPKNNVIAEDPDLPKESSVLLLWIIVAIPTIIFFCGLIVFIIRSHLRLGDLCKKPRQSEQVEQVSLMCELGDLCKKARQSEQVESYTPGP